MAEEKKTSEFTEKKVAAPKKAATPKKTVMTPKKPVPQSAPVVEPPPVAKTAPVVEVPPVAKIAPVVETTPEKTGFEVTVGVDHRVVGGHGHGVIVSRGVRKDKSGAEFGVFVVRLDNGEVREYTQGALRPE
jgi:hypothetical protein